MNVVEPIRDIKVLNKIRDSLKAYNKKYYFIFEYGISTGLRVSDILKLTVQDLQKDFIEIREEKTNKPKKFQIKSELKKDLLEYAKENNLKKYIFLTSWEKCNGKPIQRCQVYKVLNKCAKQAGYFQKIGTHSMRKTFGYHFYKQTHDVVLLQKIFNHSSPSVTLRYIGITQDMVDEAYKNFDYGQQEKMFVTNEDLNEKICKLEQQISKLEETITACMNYGFDRIDKILNY